MSKEYLLHKSVGPTALCGESGYRTLRWEKVTCPKCLAKKPVSEK